jgi:DHA1 family bicyclomycin/chloramphenicol resistance-like MFS transporter
LLQVATIRQETSDQLGSGAMLALITLLTAFPMLSTDLYLPALPSISQQLGTSVELVNLTLVVFFIFISISALVCGPLSDRLGRKPVLLAGVTLFFVASIACALSSNIYFLIFSRAFQALGAGSGVSISTAIVKDFFPLHKKERAFALISALVGIVPIVAPVIGAQLLKWMSWRGAFIGFALTGLVVIFLGLRFQETHHDRSTDPVPVSILRLFVVLRNPAFARLLALFALSPLPMFAYVGISAILYIQDFGLTEQQFSLYFAANAFIVIAGSVMYIYLSKFIRPVTILTASFLISFVSGILIITVGGNHPALLLLSTATGTFGFSIQRPPSLNFMLEQQDSDTGSASALMNSLMMFIGSFGLYLVSLEWENRFVVLGMMFAVVNIIGWLFWLYAKRHCRIPKNTVHN